jgi:glycosyltransferase involved in cell wall biosynthesis
MKLVCISLTPVPYTTPILNALAEHVDLHVVYMGDEDRINRFTDTWGEAPTFDHSVFWSRTVRWEAIDLQTHFSIGISRRLARLKPDVLLVVSWKPVALEPLLWARLSGCATVMWSESTSFSGMLRGSLSTRIRRRIVGMLDGFVTNGSQATAYLVALGIPAARIVTSRLPAGATDAGQDVSVQAAGSNGVRFLYVGRLIPRKRPLELIQAFETVRRELPEATLMLVGKGELEQQVRDASVRVPGVRYAGYCEAGELAEHYSRSDVLVLPALREVWGLVVNEALAHGLFVVATDEVGSAYDLLDEGSGVMVPAHDVARLAPALVDAARTGDFGEAARRRRALGVSDCTPERFAQDIYRAAQLAARTAVPAHGQSA